VEIPLIKTTLLLLAALGLFASAPKNGEELIREMHARYDGKWYHTLTFTQKTTDADGKVETWFEAAKIPGYLRIDIMPIDSSKAITFRHDSIYVFDQAAVKVSRPFVHPLMVLGFDVYADRPETTIKKLTDLKFDLTKLHTDTWQGKPVYVVGADSGDIKTNQFWVDQENLLFVRMLQAGQNGTVLETQFNKYQRLGNGWVSPEVIFMRDGKVVTTEEYSDIRSDVTLPDTLFATTYGKPDWVITPVRQ
jgi:outer membrane lipoprotein-sorting protein